ncbi:MAG: tetratricopeptide repeat protein [Flavobacteriales bacterium]|nr:tetratricopeptide repeat protein [Flavobacteriales bacterium]
MSLSKYPVILLALTFVLYGNTLPNQYAIDDPIVTNNPLIQKGIKAIPEIFTSRYRVYGEYNYGYRPIVKSSFAIEYTLFGQNPWVSHLLNLIFYGLTCVFLFYLLRKLLRKYDELLPFIITVLFIAHPIHTEAVASLKNREEIFSFLGCITALYFFLKFTEYRKIKHLVFGLFCFVFAFLSKQNALTFLAVIPLAIYFFSDVSGGFLKSLTDILMNRLSAGGKRFVNTSKVYVIFMLKLANRYKILLIGLVCYVMAIINGAGDFYQYALVAMVVHYTSDTSEKRLKLLIGLKNSYTLAGFAFLAAFLVLSNLRAIGVVQSPYPATLLSMMAVLSFSAYFYRFNSAIISNGATLLKSPLILLGICTWILAAKLSSYNIYNLEIFALNTITIACLYFYFSKRSGKGERPDLAKATEQISSSEGKRLAISDINIPMVSRALVLVVALLAATAYIALQGPDMYLPEEQRELKVFENPLFYEDNIWVTIATGFYSLLIYLKLLLLPHPLVFYYGFNHIPVVSMANGWVVLSLIIHLVLLLIAVKGIKTRSVLSFAIFYYLATISIFSNIVYPVPGIVGERLLFMPSLGFCIALGYIIFKLFAGTTVSMIGSSVKRKVLMLTVLIVLPYSAKTITRNFDWKDHLTLYLHDIPYIENSLHANALVASHVLRAINPNPNTPGEATENQKYLTLAVKHFKQVLVLDPDHVQTLNNLGTVYYDFYQDYEQAIPYFDKVLVLDPGFEIASFNIGYCYEQLGKDQMAKKAYIRAISIRNDHIKSISNLANLYFKLGIQDSAVILNERIMELDSLLDIPYVNVGNYYIQIGQEPKAVELFEKAVSLNRGNRGLCQNLSDYFKRTGEIEKAAYYAQLASTNQ